LESSSKWRKPVKPNKQAQVNLVLARIGFSLVSLTIAAKISRLIGIFLTTGLAKDLHKPSKMVVIKRLQDGEGIPAAPFSHNNVCTISAAGFF